MLRIIALNQSVIKSLSNGAFEPQNSSYLQGILAFFKSFPLHSYSFHSNYFLQDMVVVIAIFFKNNYICLIISLAVLKKYSQLTLFLIINVSSMTDINNKNCDFFILNICEQSIIANTIPPLS